GGVGRVILTAPRGLVALPVNYRVLDATILYRTAEDGTLARDTWMRIRPSGISGRIILPEGPPIIDSA
ncbi:hypothetical protein ACWC9T_19165, partial [Kitasatospora sp. NPDC001159]